MRLAFWTAQDREEAGEKARRLHSAWLTDAVVTGKSTPKIPVREVEQGGFSRVAASALARERADRWWTIALERVYG